MELSANMAARVEKTDLHSQDVAFTHGTGAMLQQPRLNARLVEEVTKGGDRGKGERDRKRKKDISLLHSPAVPF